MSRESERESASFWMREAMPVRPSLRGSMEADVAVIGAGFTGLGAALAARAAGLSVAVLVRSLMLLDDRLDRGASAHHAAQSRS